MIFPERVKVYVYASRGSDILPIEGKLLDIDDRGILIEVEDYITMDKDIQKIVKKYYIPFTSIELIEFL